MTESQIPDQPELHMSILIIEGGDGTGKSTLAEKLALKHDAQIVHVGKPPDNAFKEKHGVQQWYAKLMMDSIKDAKVNAYGEVRIIFDRFHLGSYVYGQVFRGGPDMDVKDHSILEVMMDRGMPPLMTAMILAEPSYDTVKKVLVERFDNGEHDERGYEAPTKQEEIRHLFNMIFDLSSIGRKLKLDTFAEHSEYYATCSSTNPLDGDMRHE